VNECRVWSEAKYKGVYTYERAKVLWEVSKLSASLSDLHRYPFP